VIFKLNEIDPYEFIIKPNVNKQYEIILIFEPRCSKDNHVITTVNDLCEECQEITKYEIQKIGKCESIVKRFTVGGYDSKKLLFGRGESDVEETLQRRVNLGNIDDIINGVEHTRDTQMSVNVNSSLISDSGRRSDATKRNNCVII
jgi:transcriptional regulator NrdR family protein